MFFLEDVQNWLSCCGCFSDYPLVKKAQTECTYSIFMCSQGFYGEAITNLRQFLEHMLFAIWLSTNDYAYRLWKAGQYDMSWARIMEDQDGIFSKKFIRMYAVDLNEDRSMELISISREVYRECSEFIHGNFEKISILSNGVAYNEKAFDCYIKIFSSIQYVICVALFIRFRHVLDNSEILEKLEPVIADNLNMLSEVQLLFNLE